MGDTPSRDDVNAAASALASASASQLRVEVDEGTRGEWKDQAGRAATALREAMNTASGMQVRAGNVTIPFQSALDTERAINNSRDAVRDSIKATLYAADNLAELINSSLHKLEQQSGS